MVGQPSDVKFEFGRFYNTMVGQPSDVYNTMVGQPSDVKFEFGRTWENWWANLFQIS